MIQSNLSPKERAAMSIAALPKTFTKEEIVEFLVSLAIEVVDNEKAAFEDGFAAGATQASDDFDAIKCEIRQSGYDDGFADGTVRQLGDEERTFDSGFEHGFADGYAEGHEQGYDAGHEDGYGEGSEDAIAYL